MTSLKKFYDNNSNADFTKAAFMRLREENDIMKKMLNEKKLSNNKTTKDLQFETKNESRCPDIKSDKKTSSKMTEKEKAKKKKEADIAKRRKAKIAEKDKKKRKLR